MSRLVAGTQLLALLTGVVPQICHHGIGTTVVCNEELPETL
jgi:hypothetical protein